MLWFALACMVITVISIRFVLRYRGQLRKLCRDLRFIEENDSNLMLTQQLETSEIKILVYQLNELLRKHRALEVEYKTKDNQFRELILNLSHDIRTPLTSLDGYFQLLTQSEDPKVQERYHHIIQGRINSLKELLEQLFMYMKLQNDTYDLPLLECDLTKAVCDATLSFYQHFIDRQIEPSMEISEDKIVIECNPTALTRILNNIIKNVLEHGSDNFFLSLSTINSVAIIECKNKFCKEDAIDFVQVFDRGYKADKARTHTSTGLGLAIARELVLKMKGSIRARNEGEYFIVTIQFPDISRT